MTDEERLTCLKDGLEGSWEYICSVMSETLFPNYERGRGGIMNIIVKKDWTGLNADIVAERLWATWDALDYPGKRVAMPFPFPWNAKGGMYITDGNLFFRYLTIDDAGIGTTEDTFQILEPEGKLHLGVGTFRQRLLNGQLVTGVVRLRKMLSVDDFQWAPEGIHRSSA